MDRTGLSFPISEDKHFSVCVVVNHIFREEEQIISDDNTAMTCKGKPVQIKYDVHYCCLINN